MLEDVDFLRLLPRTLQRITGWRGLGLSARYLLNFLGDPTCLPDLIHLKVEHLAASLGRSQRASASADTLAIEAAARARGLQLVWAY